MEQVMDNKEILALVQQEMVEEPIMARLGLAEDHFHGVMVGASRKLAAGKPMEALQDYSNLVLISPLSVEFQIGLADSASQAGFPELAMQAAAFVIQNAPDRPEGYLLSGKACLAMGEPELAKEDFSDALAKAEASSEYKDAAKIARSFLTKLGGG